MRINSYQTNIYKPINFTGKKNSSMHFGLQQLKADVFQKAGSIVENCKKASLKQDNSKVNEVYNNVFGKVLEDIPVIKELKIKKPNLVFTDKLNAIASYDFPTNTIELNSSFKGKLYASFVYDKTGEMINCEIIFENQIDSTKKEAESFNVEFIELTPEEKELYLKSILAHELRHWAQEHILVSTKNCQEPYKYKLGKVQEIIQMHKQRIAVAKLGKIDKNKIKIYQKKLKETKKEFEYILKYKPKEMLDENFRLETSIIPFETKYWSMKSHFLPAALRYKNSDENEYRKNPSEIDAYLYQAEFLFREKTKYANIKPDVFQAMLMDGIQNGFIAIEKIEEFGYPPLLEN